MTLLAVFNVFQQRLTRLEQVEVGLPIANRSRPEFQGLIGLFANTLVVRSSLGDDPTFGELLERVRSTMLGAFAHQDLPFEKLVEDLHPDRDPGRNPLFQTMFVLQPRDTVQPVVDLRSCGCFPWTSATSPYASISRFTCGKRPMASWATSPTTQTCSIGRRSSG